MQSIPLSAKRPLRVRRILGNPYACRLYFFVLAHLEIADVVSDVLWLLNVVTYQAFHNERTDDNEFEYRYYDGRMAIVWSTIFFFALSVTLLFGKLSDDLRHIFAVEGSAKHSYKRLEVFGFSCIFLLTMNNEQIAEAYSQRCVAHDAEQSNLLDSMVGLHRKDNHLDERYPLLASIVVPHESSATHCPPTKLWEVMAYPIALTFSRAYFRALSPCLAFILWPFAACASVLSMMSLVLVGLGNMFAKSKHSYTIRIFEDLPQLVINVAYLLSPFGRGAANNASLLSLVLSGIMLLKFALEVAYEACTTEAQCQLVRRRVEVPQRPSAMHTLQACFLMPILVFTLAPFFFVWFLSEGLASSTRALCGHWCHDLWVSVEEAPVEEAVLGQLVGDAPDEVLTKPLLAPSTC